MANGREQALACLWVWALACDMTAAQSLPVGGAENAHANARGGVVVMPAPGTAVTQAAVEAVVRADAVRAWRLDDVHALNLGVEDVVWADGSLGCPRPGIAYTQALVPGWRLLVRHGGREAVYHASRQGQWLLCTNAQPTVSPAGEASR